MSESCKLCWQRLARGVCAGLTMFALGGCVADGERMYPTAAPQTSDQMLSGTAAYKRKFPDIIAIQGVGTSMLPNMGTGTIFNVAPTKWEDLAEGDPVVYRNASGKQIMHRLVRLEGDHWIVKGDNNELIDNSVVTRENLVGVVVGVFYSNPPADNP